MRNNATDSRHRRDGSEVEPPVSGTLAETAAGLAAAASAETGVGKVFDADDVAPHRHRRARRWAPAFRRRTE